VPNAIALEDALLQSSQLADLRRRLAESARCLDAVLPFLPVLLHPHVRSGPIDGDGWTLLAANAAVAAKLKQLRPRLEHALADQHCASRVVRIKVSQQR
jgi:hypothetical protein